MLKISSLLITYVLISISFAQPKDSSHILHGLFSDSDESHVYYGTFDLNTSQFNIFSSLSVNDVGNPKNIKYPVLPLTYDPNEDVIYIATLNNENQTILSIINATTGHLLSTFKSIRHVIISLQYDIFQKELFAHIETSYEDVTFIAEINTNNGTIKRILSAISDARPTHISSYCPICRKYFLIMIEGEQLTYIGVNTSNQSGIDWKTNINFSPMSIRFDYKTFTMYTAYINHTDKTISSIGILNRTIGGISQIVGTISDDPGFVITSLSAFDIAENIYYTSNILTRIQPPSIGVDYVNVNTSDEKSIPLPRDKFNSYGWFVKQFVH